VQGWSSCLPAEARARPIPERGSKVARELSDIMYLSAIKFKGMESAITVPWEMCSFGENKMLKLVDKFPSKLVKYNITQCSRIYPKASRIDSSNYLPSPAWNCGIQMVALNYQTSSEPLWINEGKFRANGGCGYVLKPSELLNPKIQWDPKNVKPTPPQGKKILSVEVISARQLPRGSSGGISPSIEVQVYGLPADTSSFRTSIIQDNGFNPTWNQTFTFILTYSELAVLVIRLDNSDKHAHGRIGHYSLPVDSMRSGYRIVELYDDNYQKIPMCSLLCRFAFEAVNS